MKFEKGTMEYGMMSDFYLLCRKQLSYDGNKTAYWRGFYHAADEFLGKYDTAFLEKYSLQREKDVSLPARLVDALHNEMFGVVSQDKARVLEFKKDSPEWRMFRDMTTFWQEFWTPREDEGFWLALSNAAGAIEGTTTGQPLSDFALHVAIAFMRDKDQHYFLLKDRGELENAEKEQEEQEIA